MFRRHEYEPGPRYCRSGVRFRGVLAAATTFAVFAASAADVGELAGKRGSGATDANANTGEVLGQPTEPPNVIVITVDGLGHADLGHNGGTDVATPNMDALASDGVVFANGYTVQPTSSASRAGLLSGRHPARYGLEENLAFSLSDSAQAMPHSVRMIQEDLQAAGYDTALVGKWHLGAAAGKREPRKRGFSYFFGFPGEGHDYWRTDAAALADQYLVPLVANRLRVGLDDYLTDVLTDKAIEFVERERDGSLFLQLAYSAPQAPLQAPEELLAKYAGEADEARRNYLAMVDALDGNIGRLLEGLDDAGLRDDTLIFLVGDRGASATADGGGLRGDGAGFDERDIRIPFLASWPSRWPSDVRYEPMVSSLDIAATILSMAGVARAETAPALDGVDLDRHVRGEVTEAPHEALFWRRSMTGGFAVRAGGMKLVRNHRDDVTALFDLTADPGETVDLARDNADVWNALAARWTAWNAGNSMGNLYPDAETYDAARAHFFADYAAARLQAAEDAAFRIGSFAQQEVPDAGEDGVGTGEESGATSSAEAAFTVSFSATAIGEDETATLTVETTGGGTAESDRVVGLAVFGTASANDYRLLGTDGQPLALPYRVTVPAGSTAASATLKALPDDDDEALETVLVEARLDGRSLGVAALAIGAAEEADLPTQGTPLAAPAEPPNVIVIMVDDLGYGDLGVTGAADIDTPSIDRLAAEGIFFPSGYSAHAVCSASRAALLTGRHGARFRFEGNLAASPFDTHSGLAATETTLAQRLRGAGYGTGVVGKWHLGSAEPFLPRNHGFDEFFGFLRGDHDYWRTRGGPGGVSAPLIDDETTHDLDGEYLTDVLTAKAIEFVEARASEPFLLYLAYNAPHAPLQAPETSLQKYAHVVDEGRRHYLAMVDVLDANVGRLLDALEASGLRDDTLIFFVGDNGGATEAGADNGVLTGSKGSLWEGGIRVPFVASWPARWPQGVRFDPMVSNLDIAATAMAMTGVSAATGPTLDGANLDPFVRGERVDAPHEALFWRWGKDYAVRSGDMKLVGSGSSARLYDLGGDPEETTDLMPRMADKANQLGTVWNDWNDHNPSGTVTVGLKDYRAELRRWQLAVERETRLAAGDDPIRIGVAPTEDATLKALTLSGVDVEPLYDPETTVYAGTSAWSGTRTTVTATPPDSGAGVVIADADGSTSGTTRDVMLRRGPNTITATVTAADGEKTTAYTVIVTRPPPPPAATVAVVSESVDEGAPASFTVRLDRPAKSALEVAVSVAETGAMLSGTASTVAIAAEESSATLAVTTDDDLVVEADSTVTATLGAGTGYVLGAATSADVVVVDNDSRFAVGVDPAEIEEGGTSTVTVSIANGLTFASPQTVTLVATGTAVPADYTLSPTALAIEAGGTSAAAVLTATDDPDAEDSETVTVTASHGGATVGSAVLTILDSDGPPSDDASLKALELTDIGLAFDSGTTAYAVDVPGPLAWTTVTATPNYRHATVEIGDAGGTTSGRTRTTSLAEGENEIRIVVTAQDGETTTTYTVTVTRAELAWGERRPDRDLDLSAADRPRGLWSDGTTVWAADWGAGEALAYELASGDRHGSRDITLGSYLTMTITSDGDTLWAADSAGGVYAYRLSDGERLAEDDLDGDAMAEAGNARPAGLWTDGETLWVADHDDGYVYAYAVADGTRQSGEEFSLRADDGTAYLRPLGLYSDGRTVLASDWSAGAVRAFRASDGARLSDLDIDGVASANDTASGLWSDGNTLWVVDEFEQKAYAYAVAMASTEPASDDATLRALMLSGIDIGTFGRATTTYSAAVEHGVSKTTVTVAPTDSSATVAITDSQGTTHGTSREVELAVGETEIGIAVSAADGETAATYTVTVTRAAPASTDATLASLTLSGIDIGTFDVTTSSYAAAVAHGLSSTTVTATPTDSSAAVAITDSQGTTQGTSRNVNLAVGQTDISVTVTAEDGDTTATYAVAVTRASPPSNDATLSSLNLSSVNIGTFESATTSYAGNVEHDVASTTVTATATDSSATVAITDAQGTTEGTSRAVTLTVGQTDISVTVTAADGQTTATYTVAVTRAEAPSDDAMLSALTLANVDIGTFDSATTSYAADVEHDVASTTVTATTTDTAASVAITDFEGTTQGASRTVNLAVGQNDIAVTVTAADGQTTRTYTVAVARAASDDAALSALALSGVDIGTFDPATTGYAAAVAEAVSSTTVTATPSDGEASVTITDTDGSAAGTTRDVALAYGANTVTVEVTAADGETTKAYTVTVTREYTVPTATIAATTSRVSEGTDASFKVSLDKAAKDALTVAVSVSESGDALSGSGSSVAIAKGETEATLTVGTVDDSVVEEASTVTAALAAGDGYAVGTADSAEVVVEDDDAATFAVVAASDTIEEGDATTVSVSVANGVSFATDQTVTLTASGTAASDDYALSPTSMTLGAGNASVSATLTATDDEAEEQDETVTVSASHGGTEIGTATVTIAANDAALSDDATLSALTLSGVDIGTFDAATTDYAVDVAHDVERTTVTATPNDADATVVIQDADGTTPGTARDVELDHGKNTVTATVTAADDVTTTAYTVTVTRPRPPLTASLHQVPARHDGTSDIEFELRFSEEIALSYVTLKAAYQNQVDGGTLLYTRRAAPPGNVRWRVGVKPSDDGAVVATLPGKRPCGTTGAICAADGRMLSNSPVARIPGPLPTVSIGSDGSSVSEGTAAAFTLTRTGDAAGELTVAATVAETGAMVAGNAPAEATFAAGATTAALSVATDNDAVAEAPSTVTAAVAAGTGYAVSADAGSAEVVVEDDDAATFAVGLSPATLAEGASATLTVSITNGVTFAEAQTIEVAASGTASASDYALSADGAALAAPYALILASGAPATTATLSATDDAETEAEETLTLTASHGGTEIGTATATIPANDTALSDDATLSALTLSGLNIGTFDAATTDYAATAAETVARTTVAATPTDADAGVVIQDADGTTSGAARDVELDYGKNTVTATVTAADGETTKAYTVTVTREYTVPTATIAATTSPVSEGTDAAFKVSLDKAAKDALTVAVSLSESGDALSGSGSSVAIAKGETEATLAVGTVDDGVVEEDSTVTAALAAGDGYAVGTADSAEVVVEDDDAATFAVAAGSDTIEEGDATTVTVSIANGTTFATDQTVTLTASGTAASDDYALSPTSMTLAAGNASVSATLTATDDEAEEQDETVTVSASHGGTEIGTATVTIAANDAALSDDATLSALTLSGIDIGTFEASTTAYSADVDNAVESTTVTATPNDGDATVTISDPDGSTAGTTRTTRLAEGANAISAAVTAADGETTATYTVAVTRAAASIVTWGERLPGKDIDLSAADRPRGLGSDGETLWAADWDTSGVVAYALADGARREARDFGLGAFLVTALYTDGETLWAADYQGGVYAYRLSDGERLEASDLDEETMAEAGNGRPAGLWSDGATMWVADQSDRHVYAYRLSDGARESGKEFALIVGDVEHMTPFGLWSDGETVLATDWLQGTVRGYALAGGARRSGNDIGANATANDYAAGVWSDGETLWVVEENEQKAYAYAGPGLRKPPNESGTVLPRLTSHATVVPSGMAAGPPVSIPDPGLRGRIAAALGKCDGEPIGLQELAALVVLDARRAGVTDLAGIEHAVNLEGLDLGDNPLADLRPLSSLPALRRLNLDGTEADLWELAALGGLKELSLRNNGLDDVWAFSSMNGLEVLDLAENRIDDLAALAALANLRVLDVSGNRLAELSPLAGLERLRELHVGGNLIEDFSPPAERAGLRVFGAEDQHWGD